MLVKVQNEQGEMEPDDPQVGDPHSIPLLNMVLNSLCADGRSPT